jgi:phosphoglycerate dehydrogenase-like enzyme
MNNNVLVTYEPDDTEVKLFPEILGEVANINYLARASEKKRHEFLKLADVIVALSFSERELDFREISYFQNLRFIQLVYAGADNLPFHLIPEDIILASNVGAFANPIAEHVLALVLVLAKNIIPNYKGLCEGQFDRTGFNQEISGGVCTIIGFGGNGKSIARTMKAIGMKVYGINRSGKTEASIDFIGNTKDLKWVLESSGVVVVTTPLNRETRDLIGKKELEWMQKDAILINVGRGDVINQKALYDHLKTHPDFRAGIDTWWSEPAERGELELDYPFFDLPNIIGSPHCADHVPRSMPGATRKALENVKCYLRGNPIRGIVDRNDYR